MTYRIEGLDPARIDVSGARAVIVTNKPGFPCRVSLEDAEPGEEVLLLNHVSNKADGPFRSAFAIYVREAAEPALFRDSLPPVFATRTISLRGFDADGDLRAAELAAGNAIDSAIRAMLARPEVAFINAHNAAAGCFAARIVRD